MIQKAALADDGEVLRRAAPWPVSGVLCEMHWRMWRQNPRLPHQVYLLGRQGLLEYSGGRATLCGPVEDAEELGVFLRFAGVSQLTALDFWPVGWRLVREDWALVRPAGPVAGTLGTPFGFTGEPLGQEVLQLLGEGEGPTLSAAAGEDLLCTLQARRNHGAAAVYGIKVGGMLAATAGLWALTPCAGYLASVKTRPVHRGRGFASALVNHLCAQFESRTLSLLCEEVLAGFYAGFGFLKTGQRGCVSVISEEG